MVASIVTALCVSFLILHSCAAQKPEDAAGVGSNTENRSGDEFKDQRRRMVERQIRDRGIKNQAVLEAMMKVPRHRFVTAEYVTSAYEDHPLPIGQGQTISQPYIVAYMTEAAEISDNEKVLEIGTGSGYQAAILGELAKEVYTIEIIPELAERARRTLGDLGYKNVHVKTGNGYEGWAEYAPYDGIVVTAAPDEVPKALIDQLAMNGKMVIPVGAWNQEMMIITKTAEGIIEKRTLPVRFVPMTGKPEK
jgi:protein-L-isoaspartate(D-aspartate) O-methyltransferase